MLNATQRLMVTTLAAWLVDVHHGSTPDEVYLRDELLRAADRGLSALPGEPLELVRPAPRRRRNVGRTPGALLVAIRALAVGQSADFLDLSVGNARARIGYASRTTGGTFRAVEIAGGSRVTRVR
jgi:ferric-dicitrate binding protein FerR (iron transport regulator)